LDLKAIEPLHRNNWISAGSDEVLVFDGLNASERIPPDTKRKLGGRWRVCDSWWWRSSLFFLRFFVNLVVWILEQACTGLPTRTAATAPFLGWVRHFTV
jgi:hypothetical protein